MFNELDEVIDYIENSKFASGLNDITDKIKRLKSLIISNDMVGAINFALLVNQTTDYEGLVNVRNDKELVNANPQNNPKKTTPAQHCFGTLDALIKLALKKISDHYKEDLLDKGIEMNFSKNFYSLYKTLKSISNK